MIDDPPILTLRTEFSRPDAELVVALNGVPTGFVADALGGRAALSGAIKPIDEKAGKFCGVAVTCHTGPADNLAVFAALEIAQAGDVIIIGTDAFTGTAVIGDLVLGMAKNRDVVAIVTDGYVRDIEGIRQVDLPCFAAGVTPDSPARNGPGTAGLPISLGGRSISSGDVLVGDLDGVVVIPSTQLGEVVSQMPEIKEAEAELDAKVKDGLDLPAFAIELLESDGVKRVK
jgi:4-hydroxy-4-methyl-2-oxoglutarate aldolase